MWAWSRGATAGVKNTLACAMPSVTEVRAGRLICPCRRIRAEMDAGIGVVDQMPVPRPLDGGLLAPRFVKGCKKTPAARVCAGDNGLPDHR